MAIRFFWMEKMKNCKTEIIVGLDMQSHQSDDLIYLSAGKLFICKDCSIALLKFSNVGLAV